MENRKVNGISIDFINKDLYALLKQYEHKLCQTVGLDIAKIAGNGTTFISSLFEVRLGKHGSPSPAETNQRISMNLYTLI